MGDVWQTPVAPSKDGTYVKSGRITEKGRDIKPERTVGGPLLSFAEVANRFRQATTARAKSPIRSEQGFAGRLCRPLVDLLCTSRTLRTNTTARNSNQSLVQNNHTARGFRIDRYENNFEIASKMRLLFIFSCRQSGWLFFLTNVCDCRKCTEGDVKK